MICRRTENQYCFAAAAVIWGGNFKKKNVKRISKKTRFRPIKKSRNQEKERKHAFDQEKKKETILSTKKKKKPRYRPRKKERNHAIDQEKKTRYWPRKKC